ncbi:MAG: NUDIX domain-containing protein [Rhodobacteraceae bacterium]|nr:NUDIX domain-containing protein [Paracoccaceae bacterium]
MAQNGNWTLNETKRLPVFIYGTLLDLEIRQTVIGDNQAVAAELPDHLVCAIQGRLFPALQFSQGSKATGLILQDISADQEARLDFYLDPAVFTRCDAVVMCGGQMVDVQMHMPIAGKMQACGAWDLNAWLQSLQPAALHAAIQIMRSYSVAGPYNTPIHHRGIEMRAHSSVRAARQDTPVQIRRGFVAEDVQDLERNQPYAGYFAVEDMKIRHARFDGGQSNVLERAVYLAADAVTVLPYDPVTDQLLLVEQFRPASYARNDPHPWVLEPVAGRCDANETIEAVAEREVMEEAGLTLRHLEKIGSYYSSPGCLTEYLYSFVGIVDLAGVQSQVHGLESEDEDILTHVLPFEVALATLQSGEVDNGPLLISLLWLQINRSRLQKVWGSA